MTGPINQLGTPEPPNAPAARRVLGLTVFAWRLLAVSGCVVVACFSAFVLMTDCNGIKQAINMRAAKRHIGEIAGSVLSVPGRDKIGMSDYTAGPCGAIRVWGNVPRSLDLSALRADIAATSPPVDVMFQLAYDDGEPVSVPTISVPLR